MQDDEYRVAAGLDVTNNLMNSSFWIGEYSGMTEDKLEYIKKRIHEFLNKL